MSTTPSPQKPKWKVRGWRPGDPRPNMVEHIILAATEDEARERFLRAYPKNTPVNVTVGPLLSDLR